MKIVVEPSRMRTVKSYVRRARITSCQRLAFDNYWSIYGVEASNSCLDLQYLFLKKAPVYLEIGFGMGHSLLQMAVENPDSNFLGVEVHRPGIGSLLSGIAELGLTNIRVFSGDALQILSHTLPEHSLQGVLLFFPDPWPKKRHHKRRIVQTTFLDLIAKKLIPNGYFHAATDVIDYADHIRWVVNSHSSFHTVVTCDSDPSPALIRPKTKFELRGEGLGHTITDLVFRRQ